MNKDFIIENGVLIDYIGKDTDVVIPEGVTTIGNYAFLDFYRLKSIVIPNSVRTIGYDAFYNCYNLESVVIPNSVTSIGDDVFLDCRSLKNVALPKKYTITKKQIKQILENSIIENRNSKRGLCVIIEEQTIKVCGFFLGFYFLPLFKQEIAIEKFNGLKDLFWWEKNNRIDRENFLKYLLENI